MKAWICLALCLVASPATFADFSGQLKSSTDLYQQELGEPTDTLIPYLQVDLGGKAKLNKRWRFQWQALGLTNTEAQHAPEKLYGDLREAFFQFKKSAVALRAGYNTLNWGTVDLASPSDVVNPSTFFHPLRALKRGSPMVEAQLEKESFGLHAVYIPRQRRAALPSTDSRWLPRRFLVNLEAEGQRVILPEFLEYQYLSDEELTHALDHNAGLRLTTHQGALDLNVMHFEGAAPRPQLRPTITFNFNEAQSPVQLAPVYYRTRTTGLGAVWASEKYILRLESAYQHTISKDPLLQPWAWSNVLALETNLEVESQTVTLLTQFYYSKNPRSADNMLSSSYRLFDQTAVLGGRWAWSDDLNFTGSALYETRTRGVFWLVSFEQKLTDVLKWGGGWRDFSASRDGLLKTFDRNDHANLELTYYF